ncbi:hypothetical protein [Streptomyces sp. NBC_00083]|uniref:hypothetical protein n=1 Tax=Streptomyces sp. NBC_00083 TaxID=2975647 RepID=UPI00224EE775|nr:hypothetical protein [Streptomyces sp. NBC_00083]MCX5382026.1 hypothetical protein [Streptomyces sp. NBC_00083]
MIRIHLPQATAAVALVLGAALLPLAATAPAAPHVAAGASTAPSAPVASTDSLSWGG